MSRTKSHAKSADWTEEETFDVLQAWGPKYEELRSASQREKIAYSKNKECHPGSTRTLVQVKKRLKNLEYEFKQLKQRTRSTGEARIKSIKNGFPYFHCFDEVMGHSDSVDLPKMTIEGSAPFANGESVASNAAADVTEISTNSSIEETPSTATDIGGKRRTDEKSRSIRSKGRDEMLKMVALLLNGSQSFLKRGSAVWKKTTPSTKGPLKCFVKRKISRWRKPMPFLLDSKILSKM